MLGAFTKNTLITIVTRGLILIFGIGISVIIARILGPEGKGIYSLAILLPSFLVYFCSFSISQASIFYLGKRKYSSREVLGNNIIYTFLISIFATIIGLIIVFFFADKLFPNVEIKYLLLALFLLPGYFFFGYISSILLGLQGFKKYNFISFFQKFLLFFLVVIFLLGFHFGIKATIIAEILASFITCIVLFFITKKETGGISLKLNKDYFKDSFLYGIKVYLGNILFFLNHRIGLWLINIFLSPLMVGLYSISIGLSGKVWVISDSVGTVLFPKISSENDKVKIKEFTPLVFRSVLFSVILIAILLFAIARWLIILLYSDTFFESIKPCQILLIGTIAISGWKVLESDLRGRGKAVLNTYVIGISTFLNIILNILWIPKFGIVGAAWAAVISYTIALLITLFIYSKISGNSITEIFFFKKSDIAFYRNFLIIIKEKLKHSKN